MAFDGGGLIYQSHRLGEAFPALGDWQVFFTERGADRLYLAGFKTNPSGALMTSEAVLAYVTFEVAPSVEQGSEMEVRFTEDVSSGDGQGQDLAVEVISGRITVDPRVATDVQSASEVPVSYALGQNYPNPFNPSTEIGFTLKEGGRVQLLVYDVAGREVARLVDQPLSAGRHAVQWDASRLPSGLYLYRLTAGSFTETRAMVLLK